MSAGVVGAEYGDPAGWVEIMWGALDGDGSKDWEPERHNAVATAIQYGLPLYRVTITYTRDAIPGSDLTEARTPSVQADPS